MKIPRIMLLASHGLVAFAGFAAGIYALPILTAPAAPSHAQIQQLSQQATYSAQFTRNLQDSDFLHWGEGQVAIGPDWISFAGKLAPGPDYKLYLAPEFVETEAAFEQQKHRMVMVGDVTTFDNFAVQIPDDIDVSQYSTVIVWCESFGEFITAGQYN
ncbi:DM13 domain-containing protein [Neiella sp. HB171785]|uniref:DM13 domain-containing protein n=1 Tax=Neiella litorisoli TaxID=2771431 RepID=A0A8J6QIB2_9GAMM|nr:DM13 domain-containing protein [Neiella litorisoli]MBD1390485.1 DM13 domain-containing protein [Neiella litorisoli]